MQISKSVSPKTARPDTQADSEKSTGRPRQTNITPTLSARADAPQKKNLLAVDDALSGIESTLGEGLRHLPEAESLCNTRRNLSESMQHLWSLPVNSVAFHQACATAKNEFMELMYRADNLTLNHKGYGIDKSCAEKLNGVMMQVRDKFQMMFAMQLGVWNEKDSKSIANLCTQPEPVQLSHARPQLTHTRKRSNLDEVGSISPRRKNTSTSDSTAIRVATSPRSPRLTSARKNGDGHSGTQADVRSTPLPSKTAMTNATTTTNKD